MPTNPILRDRDFLERIEDDFLSPYAIKCRYSKGREYPENEHPLRPAFQRDRARIIHCKAFRRLEYKTQVFVNHEGDHYRTRLTHSLEVAQIARAMARILGLNEELAECVSLAHDLGHTPFGHSGEEVMNQLMKDHGGFEHNRQSLRLITRLEKVYPDFPGLNLTFEVRDGVSKHFTDYDNQGMKIDGHYSLEAELVNLADEIAYNNHDLDDGLRSGMINLKQLKEIEIWQEEYDQVCERMPHENDSIRRSQTVRFLINRLATDLIQTVSQKIEEYKIQTLEDFWKCEEKIVGFSEETRKKNAKLKKFLYQNLYQHYRVVRMADKAQNIIRDIFQAYVANPKILPRHIQESCDREGVHRAVCDYIAGMTDRFALEEYDKLFNPRQRV